jgi:hypothetical protein
MATRSEEAANDVYVFDRDFRIVLLILKELTAKIYPGGVSKFFPSHSHSGQRLR